MCKTSNMQKRSADASHGQKHQKVNQVEPLHADLICGTAAVVLETNWVLPLFCLEMEKMLNVFGLKMLALNLQAY